MNNKCARYLAAGLVFMFAAVAALGTMAVAPNAAAATEIRYIVNGIPVTNYDIARREAFLRLQRKRGNLKQAAADEMIDQALRAYEIKRLKINISDEAVEQSYANFAKSNKMSTSQMDRVLTQSGVTTRHFKEFIRAQMGWSQALGARFRSSGQLSEQDVVHRMLQQGGEKPTAVEYMLQQVIFVVPNDERKSRLAARKREAEAMRNRFSGCDSTREFAKGLIDVTVRDLGRVLEPELPPDWKDYILDSGSGKATKVRVTDRGVEFIGICSAREVSDDRVAQMVFQNEDTGSENAAKLSEKYMAELKKNARIVER